MSRVRAVLDAALAGSDAGCGAVTLLHFRRFAIELHKLGKVYIASESTLYGFQICFAPTRGTG